VTALDRRPAATPVYLGSGVDAAFGMVHAPAGDRASSTAVVIAPPWGWDDVSSYRTRRTWADELAQAGHPTLRLDLPGTGDSGGSAAEPGRIAAGAAAISAAATWLRASSGATRVAVLGLGFGGIVAAKAVAAGAPIDDLVLWAVPARGRGMVRQLRAFAGLQGSRYSLSGEPEPSVLPEGWLEVNGFVLSADSIAELESIEMTALPASGLQRVLLLDQDGIAVDEAVAQHLRDAGAEVTVRPGPGWGAMTFHPERPAVPTEVLVTVRGWLAEAPASVTALRAPMPVPEVTDELDQTVDGVVVRETPIVFDGPAGRLFGVLTRPAVLPAAPLSGVFLNAGAVRRIGPNRIWVDTARHWAAQGVATLRMDLEGIGDSDGDEERYRDVAQFYVRDEVADQIRGAIDALAHRGYGSNVVLAGLCAGGFWAFRGADLDTRVRAAFLLNPGALEWQADLVELRRAARLHRLRHWAWWRRILTGGVPFASMREVAGASVRRVQRAVTGLPARVLRRAAAPHDAATTSGAILDRLSAAGTTVVMAFSTDEPLYLELERNGFLARSHRWSTLRLDRLPGRDHTLRPIVAQRAARALLDRELARELERIQALDGERAQPGPAAPARTA
jgi:alpha/beta superfamily hydrolase